MPYLVPKIAMQYFVTNKMPSFQAKRSIVYAKSLNAQILSEGLHSGNDTIRNLMLGTVMKHYQRPRLKQSWTD